MYNFSFIHLFIRHFINYLAQEISVIQHLNTLSMLQCFNTNNPELIVYWERKAYKKIIYKII